MPTNSWFKTIPELYESRQRLKEWLISYLGKCDITGKAGVLDLHEGLVECNDLNGTHKKSEEIKIELWKPVLLHPANVFLLDHDFHLYNKPSRDNFLEIARARPNEFYQDYVLQNWRFKTAETAIHHFYLLWQVFREQGIIKTLPKLPYYAQ